MTSGYDIQSENDVYFLVGFCDDMLIHINEYWVHCDCHETNWSISLKCNLIFMEFNFATSDEKKNIFRYTYYANVYNMRQVLLVVTAKQTPHYLIFKSCKSLGWLK